MDGLSASDVAMLNNDGGMGGMNGAFWIFALLILANGGIGGWGNNNGNTNAIQADVNRGFDNQNLQAQTRDILAAVTNGKAQTIAASTQNASNAITAIKDGNAALIREFGNVETALTAMGGANQQCCCEILRAIDNSNFLNSQNTAAINANITAQTQKVLDAMDMSKAALQASSTNVQAVIANGQINVGTIKLRFGRDIGTNDGSITFKTCGYYKIDTSVTIQPTAIGEVAIKLQHNGVDIPGATAFGYATVADQNVTMNISSIIRVTCQNGCSCESIPDTVSIVLVDGPGDVVSTLTDVVKL